MLFEAVFGAILSAVNFIVGGLVAIAGVITSLFLSLAVNILNAVISTGFISLSYTNPATNPFISIGWELTRGLTNIIFVLALLAIGLGTAFKMNDYQAKKALPMLIIIAILINFTPVLLGLIVDASNIVMNYFLSSGFQGGNVLENQLSQIGNLWAPTAEGALDPVVQGNKFIGLLVVVSFNVIAALIFFIFAAIFLMRYVVIWLLVILSPIAFACYILPKTRSVFNQWWKQFTQWTFVGVTAGFFLYIANQLNNLILGEGANKIAFASRTGEGLGLINSILPWAIIIIFLILGLQAAMSSSAQGANFAINAVKKAPQNFAKTRIGGKLLGGAAAGMQKGLGGFAPQLERLKKIPMVGKGLNWATKPLGWTTRGLNRVVGPKLIEYAGKTGKIALPQGFENWTGPQQQAWSDARNLDKNDRLRVGSKMGGNLEYTSDDFRKRVKDSASSAIMKEDFSYQEEAKAIAKVFPEIIGEKVRESMKLFGKKGIDRSAALKTVREDIDAALKFIRSNLNLTDDNSVISLGLKLKYITPDDVSKDRMKALNNVNEKLKNEAAAATYVRDFKAGDIGKIANTKTLGTRTGFILGNPNNFQKIVDEHGVGALKDAVEGDGGLNDATNTAIKLDKFFDTNKYASSFFKNPALSHVDFAGRSQMRDPDDQPTNRLDLFEKKRKIEDLLKKDPLAEGYSNLQKEIKELDQTRQEIIQKIARNEVKEIAQARSQINKIEQELMRNADLLIKNEEMIEKNPTSRETLKEVERIRTQPTNKKSKRK